MNIVIYLSNMLVSTLTPLCFCQDHPCPSRVWRLPCPLPCPVSDLCVPDCFGDLSISASGYRIWYVLEPEQHVSYLFIYPVTHLLSEHTTFFFKKAKKERKKKSHFKPNLLKICAYKNVCKLDYTHTCTHTKCSFHCVVTGILKWLYKLIYGGTCSCFFHHAHGLKCFHSSQRAKQFI